MSAAANAAVIAAAAQRKRLLDQEEEEMTKYSVEELTDWEFKILRANTSAFKNPYTLKKVIEEESQSGWIFLEKFDDTRIRFKRKTADRKNDNKQAIDPYRSTYGVTQWVIVAVVFGGVIFFTFAIIFVALLFSGL